jgi:(1->4)-alpha-D-glucan 1-alpha-D-glucosylmutase
MNSGRGSKGKPPLRMKNAGMRPSPGVTAIAEEVLARRRVPVATYRLQFGPNLTFRDAAALVAYLSDLGVTDCYTSPIFKTCSEHSHGYDICDHSQLNPDLGSGEDFEAFVAALRGHGMGLLLDMVPNHMGIGGSANAWWMDVLENGPSSIYAPLFDIDWQPMTPELENRVLIPILEDQYGRVLERGELRLTYEDGAFFIYYGQTRLPVAPRTYDGILGYRLDALAESLGEESEHLQELRSIITAVNYLPLRTELDAEKIAERNREKEVIKRRLAAVYESSPDVRAAIDTAVRDFNGTVGDPHSFDMLDALVDAQAYRLAYWRVASDEINYRRFFDINDLAAISVERPEVFESAHELVLELLAEGKVDGLRVDHADGLWDPASYFLRLQERYLLGQVRARLNQGGSENDIANAVAAWFAAQLNKKSPTAALPLYVVAEKVLSDGEPLPADWAVCGTTGYDFLNAVNGLFVERRSRRTFDRIYAHFTRSQINFPNLVNSDKKMIMLVSLASEINDLSHRLERMAKRNRRYRDFTLNTLTFAIREVIACLPVYRTYITGSGAVSRRDETYIEAAVSEAKRRNPRTASAIFDFVRDTLLLRNVEEFEEEDRAEVINFVMRFQQMTGPVMAKGVEDTAFYVYNRLVSLNEVGGHPERFGVPVAAFHRQNAQRLRRWPHSLLTTSTHDAKRSEDVRARINVLSEMPGEWQDAVSRWSRLNARHKTVVDDQAAPDRNDEYLLYQTLLGAWPLEPTTREEFAEFRERIAAYMLKATKEAKVHTSWVNPHEQYDAAVRAFVLQVLADDGNPFLDDLRPFQRRAAYYGHLNSLVQVLLKITSPGVPDVYQGTEVWDFSLVDPDNRRPVDFAARVRALDELRQREEVGVAPLVRELVSHWEDGRMKLYLMRKALNFRKSQSDLFREGDYLPLPVRGDCAQHIVGFARRKGPAWALVAVPRLMTGLCAVGELPLGAKVWGETVIMLPQEAPEDWRNVFTGEAAKVSPASGMRSLHLRDVFLSFPVALLSNAFS